MARINTVLFDLDGTLLDTAQDLTDAVNHILNQHGRQPLSLQALRANVSNGALAMIRQAFAIEAVDDPRLPGLRDHMLDYYARNICTHTRMFPGLEAVLTELEQRAIRWGVVTNKPQRFTLPLMDCLDLSRRAVCIVSGDTTAHAKPHPEPMLHACRLADTSPQSCVYLGDDLRDIQAGRNAGMATLVAGFGYITPADQAHSWGADGIVQAPVEILHWLKAGA